MTSMGKTTIITSILLILLGVGLYVGTGSAHKTSLIPTFLGIPILICGLLSAQESRRALVMHIAIVLATLGALAGFGRGIQALVTKGAGAASLGTLAMGIICLYFVIACIRSFKAARAARG